MPDEKTETGKKPYAAPTITNHGRVMGATQGLARWQIEGPTGWQAKEIE